MSSLKISYRAVFRPAVNYLFSKTYAVFDCFFFRFERIARAKLPLDILAIFVFANVKLQAPFARVCELKWGGTDKVSLVGNSVQVVFLRECGPNF